MKAIGDRYGDGSLLREMGLLDVAFMDIRHMNPRAGIGNKTAAVQKNSHCIGTTVQQTLQEQNYICKKDRSMDWSANYFGQLFLFCLFAF